MVHFNILVNTSGNNVWILTIIRWQVSTSENNFMRIKGTVGPLQRTKQKVASNQCNLPSCYYCCFCCASFPANNATLIAMVPFKTSRNVVWFACWTEFPQVSTASGMEKNDSLFSQQLLLSRLSENITMLFSPLLH